MDQNMFLKNFVRMRQSLHKEDDVLAAKMGKMKLSKPSSEANSVSFSTIIEEKPKDKVVIEYFKNLCEKLNQES
jgi:hypothetical protein